MAKNLKAAIEKNRLVAEELNRALRDCLAVLKDAPETVVEGRFRVVEGGRRSAGGR